MPRSESWGVGLWCYSFFGGLEVTGTFLQVLNSKSYRSRHAGHMANLVHLEASRAEGGGRGGSSVNLTNYLICLETLCF